MGYTTEFTGNFKLNKPLDHKTADILNGLNRTRRMMRDPKKLAKVLNITYEECIKKYGKEAEFYFNFLESGQQNDDSIVDYNRPPHCQPSLWCQWMYNPEKQTIEWDQGEKFYEYIGWLKYILNILPEEYTVNGTVRWQGENRKDSGTIDVHNNTIFIYLPSLPVGEE